MANGTPAYSALVDEVINMLECGEMPWRKPWVVERPRNLFTRKAYHGSNVLALTLVASKRGYVSNWWLTERQAIKRSGCVRAEELDHPASISMMYWHPYMTLSKLGKPVRVSVLRGRDYRVYNIEQTRGLGRLLPEQMSLELWPSKARHIVDTWREAPTLTTDPQRAFYSPARDVIALPPAESFTSTSEYYSTLFHEMVHSTGHCSRLGRYKSVDTDNRFGSESYAFEELVAELGAVFLCAEAGLANQTLQNNAAYIGSWLHVLRRNKSKLFIASVQAEHACNFVLGRKTLEKKSEAGTAPEPAMPDDAAACDLGRDHFAVARAA